MLSQLVSAEQVAEQPLHIDVGPRVADAQRERVSRVFLQQITLHFFGIGMYVEKAVTTSCGQLRTESLQRAGHPHY